MRLRCLAFSSPLLFPNLKFETSLTAAKSAVHIPNIPHPKHPKQPLLSLLCRLPALRLLHEQWQGPISAAVFIPYPATTDDGETCRDSVLAYLNAILPDTETGEEQDVAAPLAVSLLYATDTSSSASCKVARAQRRALLTSQNTRSQKVSRAARLTSRKRGKREYIAWSEAAGMAPVWRPQPQHTASVVPTTHQPWLQLYNSFYPVNTLRNLAWKQVRRLNRCDPGRGHDIQFLRLCFRCQHTRPVTRSPSEDTSLCLDSKKLGCRPLTVQAHTQWPDQRCALQQPSPRAGAGGPVRFRL